MRRRALIGIFTAAGAAAAVGLYRFTNLLVKHYPPTPYDDVLAALADRERAKKFGALVKGAPAAEALAARLRGTLKPDLRTAAKADAGAGRLVDVSGWLVPESVALLSALAAKV